MPSRKELIVELTKVFNHFIKLKDANSQGFVKCFTCDNVHHISNIDAGHFQGSRKQSVRWDEMNVKPQCRKCNSTNNGMRKEFADRLDEKYGQGTAENLIRKANKVRSYSSSELKDMIEYYKG
jgi:hypothetical protein